MPNGNTFPQKGNLDLLAGFGKIDALLTELAVRRVQPAHNDSGPNALVVIITARLGRKRSCCGKGSTAIRRR